MFGELLGWEDLEAPDANLRIYRGFLTPDLAQKYYAELHSGVPWQQDQITLYGKEHPLPRLHCWYGDLGLAYKWSGVQMNPVPWSPSLLEIRKLLESETGNTFNSLLANLYRSGKDTVGWHSDDEPELGPEPVIASLSLGATRDFVLRHKLLPKTTQVKIPLASGDLFVMSGITQHYWQHALPRRAFAGARINLTFRTIKRS